MVVSVAARNANASEEQLARRPERQGTLAVSSSSPLYFKHLTCTEPPFSPTRQGIPLWTLGLAASKQIF